MKINFDSPTEDVRIEIVPLIDIIFCILIFFILAAVGLTRQQAISVDLPQASTGAAQMRDMMIVSIDAVGQTYVEKELIFSREELRRRVLAYRAQHPSGLIVLYASRTAIYEDVVQILDLLRSVGGDRVALATLPSTGEPTSPNPGATVPPFPNIPGLTPLPNNPVNPALPGQPNNSTLDPAAPGVLLPSPFPVVPTPTVPAAPEAPAPEN